MVVRLCELSKVRGRTNQKMNNLDVSIQTKLLYIVDTCVTDVCTVIYWYSLHVHCLGLSNVGQCVTIEGKHAPNEERTHKSHYTIQISYMIRYTSLKYLWNESMSMCSV